MQQHFSREFTQAWITRNIIILNKNYLFLPALKWQTCFKAFACKVIIIHMLNQNCEKER